MKHCRGAADTFYNSQYTLVFVSVFVFIFVIVFVFVFVFVYVFEFVLWWSTDGEPLKPSSTPNTHYCCLHFGMYCCIGVCIRIVLISLVLILVWVSLVFPLSLIFLCLGVILRSRSVTLISNQPLLASPFTSKRDAQLVPLWWRWWWWWYICV